MTAPNSSDMRMAVAGIGFFAARNRKSANPVPAVRSDNPIFDALWDEQRPPMFREEPSDV